MTGAPSRLGRYELITRLGEGGMAEVQLALQHGPAGFEKLVVIKLVHQTLAAEKPFVDMLLDEARVAALVKHPNVVDIYDLGEADGRYFIAMEYLEGEPLLGLLRAGRDGKRLDPLSTARLIADTAEGLDAAHELRSLAGVPMELVHHDVSLGNIVVLYNGQVKLVDFGVAKASQSAGPQMRVHGKFGYMAPEKLRGRPGDRRSDIWSLGVVLWEALTLKRLFRGTSESETMKQVLDLIIARPSAINRDAPPELDPIVMRALERDPDRRYPSAKQLAQDIEEVLRIHTYGGRNDLIAKYMQATFASHIAARKKLLQEVSSKGRASADVLEALLAEPARITDTPPVGMRNIRASGEFSVRFNRAPSEPSLITEVPTAEGTPVTDPIEIIERRRHSDQLLAEGTLVSPLPLRNPLDLDASTVRQVRSATEPPDEDDAMTTIAPRSLVPDASVDVDDLPDASVPALASATITADSIEAALEQVTARVHGSTIDLPADPPPIVPALPAIEAAPPSDPGEVPVLARAAEPLIQPSGTATRVPSRPIWPYLVGAGLVVAMLVCLALLLH